jgi:hypothetical protein
VILTLVVTLLLGYAAAMFAGDLRDRRRHRHGVAS